MTIVMGTIKFLLLIDDSIMNLFINLYMSW